MDLPTYSGVFSFEKRLYAIYDFELPVPVSLFQMVAFVAALLVMVVVAGGVFEVELTPGSTWAFVVPPVLTAYVASRPLADGRRPHHWFFSQVRYLGEPRTLVRLRAERGVLHRVRLYIQRCPGRRSPRREWVPPRLRPRGAALVVTRGGQQFSGSADQQPTGSLGESAVGETK